MEKELRVRPVLDLTIRKTDEDGKAIVGGYVNKFEQLSEDLGWFKEKVRKGAFDRSIKEQPVLAFWNHNSDLVLGNTDNKTLKVWEDEEGLRFELELPDTSAGLDAMKLIERGDVKGVSFGFRTIKDEWDETDQRNPIRTLIDVELYEVSPTPMPAYPQSSVAARSILESHQKEREAIEKEQGAQKEQMRLIAAKCRSMQLQIMGMEESRK